MGLHHVHPGLLLASEDVVVWRWSARSFPQRSYLPSLKWQRRQPERAEAAGCCVLRYVLPALLFVLPVLLCVAACSRHVRDRERGVSRSSPARPATAGLPVEFVYPKLISSLFTLGNAHGHGFSTHAVRSRDHPRAKRERGDAWRHPRCVGPLRERAPKSQSRIVLMSRDET